MPVFLSHKPCVAIAASRTHPIPTAAIPVRPSAAAAPRAPRGFPAPTSSRRPTPVRPRPAGNKDSGRGGRSLRLLETYVVRETRYTQTRPKEGGGALVCFKTLSLA